MVPSDDESDLPEDAEPKPPDLGPEVPSVDVPGPDEGLTESLTPESDVDPETHRTFWRLVVVIDVALLALTVGPMLIYFEGDWRRGLAMVSLGLLVSAYGLRTYRGCSKRRSLTRGRNRFAKQPTATSRWAISVSRPDCPGCWGGEPSRANRDDRAKRRDRKQTNPLRQH